MVQSWEEPGAHFTIWLLKLKPCCVSCGFRGFWSLLTGRNASSESVRHTSCPRVGFYLAEMFANAGRSRVIDKVYINSFSPEDDATTHVSISDISEPRLRRRREILNEDMSALTGFRGEIRPFSEARHIYSFRLGFALSPSICLMRWNENAEDCSF